MRLTWSFLLLVHCPAFSEEFVVGVEEISYQPYYSLQNDGRYVGFARDMLHAAAKSTGHTFVYRPLPIER